MMRLSRRPCEGLLYLQSWIDQLRWQWLKPMEKLARMLLDHLEGILNYCPDEGTDGSDRKPPTITSKLRFGSAAGIATWTICC
jgi:hypothetical protein